MEKKPTLAYIDHILHRENGSNMFLKEVLNQHFEVTSLWVDPWGAPRVIPVEEINKYDYVLFFQRINPFSELTRVTAKIIWVAVYDSLPSDYFYWKAISTLPIKVICFSKKVVEVCARYGIPNIYAKYYPDPETLNDCSPKTEKNEVLFWFRSTVSFKNVMSVLNPNEISRLTYRSAPDHNFKPETLGRQDIEKYKVSFDNRPFSKHNILKELFVDHPIFIEPRQMEGIGLAYLEALASGHCVIANNDATMNEYIRHGVNGIIVDYKRPQKVSLKNWKELAANARASCVKGRNEWLASTGRIIEFVESETKPAIVESGSSKLWRSIYAFKHSIFKTKQDVIRRSKIKTKKTR